ncbi:MAG TPA: DUF2474 domain-containing protein [Herbaspirillum sp.]|jgi:hypothetical protein
MPASNSAPDHRQEPAAAPAVRKWFSRIGWLLLIWCASVAALGAVALGLRFVMGLAGMST